jgi:hypothetical protein|tara:strand:+ start:27 stop:443 length:417 start_codon:yes stop_codon:yes gene_type:complete
MKISDLKEIIKPIVKECIAEALIEEGMLYTVVSEVARGMSPVIMESAQAQPQPQQREPDVRRVDESKVRKQKEQRKKLLDVIGNDAYNGVDLFEGTKPASAQLSPRAQAANPLSNVSAEDPGVDIDSFFPGNSRRRVV